MNERRDPPQQRCRPRRIGPVVASLLLLVTGCGKGGGTHPATTASSPTTAAASTSTTPTTTPETSAVTTSSAATTSVATSSTTMPIDEGPSVSEGQTLNRIWFLVGERLAPAYREGTTAAAAIRDLLAGPVADDGAGAVTNIPAGTRLRSISVADGVATVDLTGEFGSGGDSRSMMGRVAQLVFTITEFPRVDAVALELDGTKADFLSGEGIDLTTPLGRDTFEGFKPFIVVTTPLPGQEVSSPFLVSGENSTDENTVEISLVTDDNRKLLSTFTTGTGPIRDDQGNPVWGPFEASIAFDPASATGGILTVFASSSDTGLPLVQIPVPVRFSANPSPGLPRSSTQPVSTPDTPGGPGITAQLVDVRTARHEGYERVVFEFSTNVVPGFTVRYVDGPITADPSDLPVDVPGDAYLSVRMSSASGVDLTSNTFRETYTGPKRLSLGYPAIQAVVETGDFEGVLNWVIGVRTRPAFKVTTLVNPTRVVIDVASG